jgi:hypothetical protein
MWHIGKRELVAMIVGSLIYGLLLYAILSFAANLNASSDGAVSWFLFYGINTFSPAGGALIVGCTFALPFFIGAEFGTWTGLVCAVAGRFLAELLLSPIFQPNGLQAPSYFPKSLYLLVGIAWALSGFIPGLASSIKKRLHVSLEPGPIGLFIFFSMLASVCSLCLADLLLYLVERDFSYSAIGHQDFLTPLWSSSLSVTASCCLASLLVLAFLLAGAEYGRFFLKRRSKRANPMRE